jgi:hypothetical protein
LGGIGAEEVVVIDMDLMGHQNEQNNANVTDTN